MISKKTIANKNKPEITGEEDWRLLNAEKQNMGQKYRFSQQYQRKLEKYSNARLPTKLKLASRPNTMLRRNANSTVNSFKRALNQALDFEQF